MNFQVTGKIELNLFNPRINSKTVADLVIKNRVPVIVTDPMYVAALRSHRAIRNGQFKIIAAIDFPKGVNFALDKLKRTHPDFAMADGFEVMLSTNRSEIELRNEMKTIYEFLKMQNGLADIRWCLGAYTRDQVQVEKLLKGMGKFPPSLVRVDQHTDLPSVDSKRHLEVAKLIRSHVPYPIKLSANVDLALIKTTMSDKDYERLVTKFDMNIDQFKTLLLDLDKEEKEARAAATASK